MKEYLQKYAAVFGIAALAAAALYMYRTGQISVSSNVSGKEMPICSVQTTEKKAALTFEVAWGNEGTEEILHILRERGIRATFFLTGDWAEKYPDEVKKIYGEGHDLGNYSESHKDMVQLSEQKKIQEITNTHKKIETLTGLQMNLFRPPYGTYDNEVIKTAEKNGYDTINWNVDSLDWKDYGVESIIQTVTENKELENGAIIRLHTGAKYTADALDGLISKLTEQGWRLVPVSELIYHGDYHMDIEGRQIKD